MKISELWLKEWVSPSLAANDLASQLTMAGLEVDSVHPVAGQFTGVIVAKVLKTKPHPQADRLTLCEIDDGSGKNLSVVCGAANVRDGLTVALATIGAKLPGDFIIKETKLRGELSQGMLCSASELGMAEQSEGILELEDNAPIGMNFRDYLKLDDSVFDIDLTPNRADCFSVIGIAREVAALNRLPLAQKQHLPVAPELDDKKTVKLLAEKACPLYCGRVVRGINKAAVTPVWMVEKLRRSGLRTLHPVVDILNYVMLESGQPMHAFDLSTLSGDIFVRFANVGEKLVLLDGQEVELDKNVLLIADNEKPLAMAGIMGGDDSAVVEETRDIFLESAWFSPLAIAGVARRYGLCTDASQRYERGVDPELQVLALEQATTLIQQICGGKAGPVICSESSNYRPERVVISFNPKDLKRLTGLQMDAKEMSNILQILGMQVTIKSEHLWEVIPPSYRFDLSISADLVEEITRINGYHQLKTQIISNPVKAGQVNALEKLTHFISYWLQSRGYHETISYSFVDPTLQSMLYPEKEAMKLLNPISNELSEMRTGLWSGLLASMIHNTHRQQGVMKLFENGVIFNLEQGQLQEVAVLGGLATGEKGALNWSEVTRVYDFYDLKGDLESLFQALALKDVEFIACEHSALHPGQSAQIRQGQKVLGYLGSLHPRWSDELDVSQPVLVFELYLQTLVQAVKPKYQAISKYPQIRRDLSFLVDDTTSAQEIRALIKAVVKPEWYRAVHVFDVYKGNGIPQGKKSLAVAIIIQDNQRTLVDSEINDLISAIINKLEVQFGILMRDLT